MAEQSDQIGSARRSLLYLLIRPVFNRQPRDSPAFLSPDMTEPCVSPRILPGQRPRTLSRLCLNDLSILLYKTQYVQVHVYAIVPANSSLQKAFSLSKYPFRVTLDLIRYPRPYYCDGHFHYTAEAFGGAQSVCLDRLIEYISEVCPWHVVE